MANTAPTKAAAKRWLDAHIGQEIDTVQVRPSGITWEPGPRTLVRDGRAGHALDGSVVRITKDHAILSVTDDSIRVEWLDEDGVRIHVTTYTAVD